MSIGDTIYYTNPTASGGFDVSSSNILIGNIINIEHTNNTTIIKAECELGLVPPTSSSFIFFSKDNVVNLSSVKGYYGLIQFKNNSTTSSEMFTVACDISQSSK